MEELNRSTNLPDEKNSVITPHKRRIHYKGRYPKNFKEKYKELQPEKYTGIADHVTGKGNTPAGTHIPIMVTEILDFLQIHPGQTGLDATLGYGGHAQAMLEKLQGKGHLYALDADPIESEKTRRRLFKIGFTEEILSIRNMNFSKIDSLVTTSGLFEFVLADLGISSMQLDNPERGFSYKVDGPLDLRMNPRRGIPASKLLQKLNKDELEQILAENADEPYAPQIANQINNTIKQGIPIQTTADLHFEIEKALAFLPVKERKDSVKKSSTCVFQALRIDINDELNALYNFLEKLPGVLSPGGKVAILTFHSGEDRLVKQAFKSYLREGIFSDIAKDVIRPSVEECMRNPCSKSTKFRWAIRAF